MKKILFLDFDGVMLPYNANIKHKEYPYIHTPIQLFDKKCVNVLNEIIQVTDCDVVITSDWRNHLEMDELIEIFHLNKIVKEPFSRTKNGKYTNPDTLESDRIYEIQEYIQQNNVTKFCVVDDLDLSLIQPFVHCVKYKTEGIKQLGIKENIIKHLL